MQTRRTGRQHGWVSDREMTGIVEGVAANSAASIERLCDLFGNGIRFALRHFMAPEDVEDKVHDIFLIVVGAIQEGQVHYPERLRSFVRTVVKRQIASFVRTAIHDRTALFSLEFGLTVADPGDGPEQAAISMEHVAIMKTLLASLSERDREVLTRFYVRCEPPERIRAEMHLTETQFRLLKSRAKAKFETLADACRSPRRRGPRRGTRKPAI